jgi:hypothetical protein
MRSRSFILSSFGRSASLFSTAATKISAIFSAVSRERRAVLEGLLRVGAVAMFRCFLVAFILPRTCNDVMPSLGRRQAAIQELDPFG